MQNKDEEEFILELQHFLAYIQKVSFNYGWIKAISRATTMFEAVFYQLSPAKRVDILQKLTDKCTEACNLIFEDLNDFAAFSRDYHEKDVAEVEASKKKNE